MASLPRPLDGSSTNIVSCCHVLRRAASRVPPVADPGQKAVPRETRHGTQGGQAGCSPLLSSSRLALLTAFGNQRHGGPSWRCWRSCRACYASLCILRRNLVARTRWRRQCGARGAAQRRGRRASAVRAAWRDIIMRALAFSSPRLQARRSLCRDAMWRTVADGQAHAYAARYRAPPLDLAAAYGSFKEACST